MSDPAPLAEEYEEIPWAELLADTTPARDRTRLLVGVVVAAGILAGAWLLTRGETAPPVPAAAPTTLAPSPPTTPAPVIPEADLRTGPPEADPLFERIAVLRAERFVADYFTLDGDPMAPTALRAAFVPAAVPDTLPHDTATEATTYVEWVEAFEREFVPPNRWNVRVAFRTIHREGDVWVRDATRAVFVAVVVDDHAGSALLDLPMPVVAPLLPFGGTAPDPSRGPSEADPTRALDYLAGFAAEVDVVATEAGEDGWRVEAVLVDAGGTAWPLAVRSDLLADAFVTDG
ncbi:MAG TPA: hypothetical protein ENK55_01510 [Actinobacteria bacterium]|nr:hypothetical protein [Actinomycetota bacterium]